MGAEWEKMGHYISGRLPLHGEKVAFSLITPRRHTRSLPTLCCVPRV